MQEERNGMHEIAKVCEVVMALQESDFEQAREIVDGQLNYSHPFKMATATKQHKLGSHNSRVLTALYALRGVIKTG